MNQNPTWGSYRKSAQENIHDIKPDNSFENAKNGQQNGIHNRAERSFRKFPDEKRKHSHKQEKYQQKKKCRKYSITSITRGLRSHIESKKPRKQRQGSSGPLLSKSRQGPRRSQEYHQKIPGCQRHSDIPPDFFF